MALPHDSARLYFWRATSHPLASMRKGLYAVNVSLRAEYADGWEFFGSRFGDSVLFILD
jgi:hypothetical protein